ncbi:MAG: hypothetical protein AAB250_08265 [Bdellovibrionota bacterium]
MMRWCEVGNEPSTQRFEALSAALTKAGVENEYSFIEFTGDPEKAFHAAERFDQVRLSGEAATRVLNHSLRTPSTLLPLKAADAYVREKNGEWWPRCFYVDALNRTFAQSTLDLDFSSGVFILGANPESRWAIASLSRIGYNKVSLCEPDESRGQAFIEDLRKTYFKLQVQYVPRHLLTQLPGVHAIGINTLIEGRDDGALAELFYFNFLKPGGAWLDLALFPFNLSLEAEAKSVGAMIIPGHRTFAIADSLWAESLGMSIEVDALTEALASSTGRLG